MSKSRIAAKKPASTHLTPNERTSHGAPDIRAVIAAAATPQVPSAPTSGAAVRAPVTEQAGAVPTPRWSPTVELPRTDNANKIDLAINEQDAPASDTPLAAAPAVNATSTETVTPTDGLDFGAAAVSRKPGNKVGSTFWVLQVMGALGAAAAAGSIAWFLIGWAPPRTVSGEWRST